MYYCVSCNETIPNNSIEDYNADSNKFPKLKGGLSFYNSDFAVCEKWNSQKMNEVSVDSLMPKINVPTLIFSGEFDPITPSGNGSFLAAKIQDSKLIKATSYSHASSFTWTGFDITNRFINPSNTKDGSMNFDANANINFVDGIYINGGVSKFGNSINIFDLLFFSPLIIALIISVLAIFVEMITLIRKKEKNRSNKIVNLLLIVSSILGVGTLIGFVIALKETASNSFCILAFGVPEHWSYLFTLLFVFIVLILLICVYFTIRIKKIENRSIILRYYSQIF